MLACCRSIYQYLYLSCLLTGSVTDPQPRCPFVFVYRHGAPTEGNRVPLLLAQWFGGLGGLQRDPAGGAGNLGAGEVAKLGSGRGGEARGWGGDKAGQRAGRGRQRIGMN